MLGKCTKDYPPKWIDYVIGVYRLYAVPIIAIFGILGNIIVILIFLLEHKKSRFSIYCVAISSTHVVILIMNSLMDDFMGKGLEHWRPEYRIKFDTYSLTMCRIMEYVPNCMYTASSGLLLVFSIDRIVTIFKPMQFYSIHFRKFAIYLCLIVVLFSCIITIPLFVSSHLEFQSNNSLKCALKNNTIGKVSVHTKVFVTFSIPTFIILILNIIICLKLWRAKIQRAKLLPGDLQKNNLEMNRICGHLALNTVFLLFTFPLVVAMMMRQYNDCSQYAKVLSRLFSSVKDISYSLDFLLYFVFLTNFRWRFIKYLVAPLLHCTSVRRSSLGLYLDSKLMKHDSNSSRRKYSAIAAALSTCNNHHMFSVLMYKTSDHTSNTRPVYEHCNSYNSSDIHHTPINSQAFKQRCSSVPRQKAVSYASDVKVNTEDETKTLLLQ